MSGEVGRVDPRVVEVLGEDLCPSWHREGSAGQTVDADGNVKYRVGERRICTAHAAQARFLAAALEPVLAEREAEARAGGWGGHHRAHCSTINPHADPGLTRGAS